MSAGNERFLEVLHTADLLVAFTDLVVADFAQENLFVDRCGTIVERIREADGIAHFG